MTTTATTDDDDQFFNQNSVATKKEILSGRLQPVLLIYVASISCQANSPLFPFWVKFIHTRDVWKNRKQTMLMRYRDKSWDGGYLEIMMKKQQDQSLSEASILT